MINLTCKIVLIVCSILIVIDTRTMVPRSPCPHLFNYYQNQNNEVYGGMRFSNDLSGLFQLEVNMSIALVTNRVKTKQK